MDAMGSSPPISSADHRVDDGLLLLLVLGQALQQEGAHRRRAPRASPAGESVRAGPPPCGSAAARARTPRCSARNRSPPGPPGRRARPGPAAERPQRVEDHRDVDRLLDDRPGDRRQQPERAEEHGPERQPHPDDARSAPRSSGTACAIAIASATRSSRSTISTTSAASLEAVAPRAPIATPTSAAASAGASLMPSPTMIVTPSPALGLHRLDLVGGIPLGEDPVDAERDADRLGHVGMVPGHHHDAPDAGAAQRPDHPGRVRADRVVDHDRAGDLAVDGDEHAARSLQRRPAPDVARPRAASARRRPRTTPCRAPPCRPSTFPSIPAPCPSSTRSGKTSSRSRSLARRRRSRSPARAARPGPARRPAATARRRSTSSNDLDVRDRGTPAVSVPVLSNSSTRPRPSVSSAPPPFDDDAALSGPADARDDRDRRREDQRAGRGDHQHGERAHGSPVAPTRRRRSRA